VAFADCAASGVCLAPLCFFLNFGTSGFFGDNPAGEPDLEVEDSDEVAEERSEAEDIETEGFFESPLIVADESEDGAWTSDGGCAVVLVGTLAFCVEAGRGELESESDSDAEEEVDSPPSDRGTALADFSEP
jgi:hypothetical protein